jgi:hypothetical protein
MPTERRDLGALEKAVNDAAGRANSLWVSFILFATLVVITTGTVTHKHLLLELPLKLPVLNVDLPLICYFIAVPLFFVVFHFYVLLQLDGLAGKIKDYNDALNAEEPFEANRRLLRQRLDTFIFAQLLVRARERREGRIGVLNRSMVGVAHRRPFGAAAHFSRISSRGCDLVASGLPAPYGLKWLPRSGSPRSGYRGSDFVR